MPSSPESKSKPKSPEKVSRENLAFGSPPNRPPAYSEISHLGVEDQKFALLLADIKIPDTPVIRKERKDFDEEKEEVIPPAKLLQDLPQPEEGVKPCGRFECKEVIRKILNSTKVNREERDDINYEKRESEGDQNEADAILLATETAYRKVMNETEDLGTQKNDTLEQVAAAERKKSLLDDTIKENTSRVMVLETELQKLRSQTQQQEAIIKDLMWRGSSRSDTLCDPKTDFQIVRCSDERLKRDDNVSQTSYYNLVADDVLDIAERSVISYASFRSQSKTLSRSLSSIQMNQKAARAKLGWRTQKSRGRSGRSRSK